MFEILGVDMGAYNLKLSNEFICKSIYTVKHDFNIRNKNILEYQGKKYQIGLGSFDTEIVKSEKDNLPLFLYGLGMSTQNKNFKIVMGLPKSQIDNEENVEKIKKKFRGNFKFKLGKEDKEINVLDVNIFPEGIGAFYTLTKDYSGKDVILVDIGGSTFNIALFINGEYIKSDTLPFGTMNVLHDIKNKVNTIHGERFNLDDIDRFLKRKKVGKTDDEMDYKFDMTEPYIEEFVSLLKLEYPYKHSDLILSGGGVELFAENVIKRFSDAELVGDYLFANSNGFANVGRVIYG